MTHAIRHALVVLPLGLILSGCAGPQRSESSFDRDSRPSARGTGRPGTMIVDRSAEPTVNVPVDSVAAKTRHDITLEQIGEHVRNNSALVIDARSPENFKRGHVRGAMNVPAGEVSSLLPRIQQAGASDRFIVIYCASPSCGAGDMVYEYLATQGYTNMRVYRPGWQTLVSQKDLL
ncbi:MAG TPA: rhodanese-like domain-containing protein [Phycisphaerae bacterium]|nr:rhodanese-like domain-containing protein [Phycisphaerae bacterium]